MPYKTILVDLNDADASVSALNTAVLLAERHGAHLLGTFIVQPMTNYVGFYGDMGASAEFDHAVDIRHKKQASHLESLFESATASQSFVSEWRYVGDSLNNSDRTLLSIGCRADLMIVSGIHKRGDDVQSAERDKLSTIVSASACPVLVIPTSHQGRTLGEHVMLAYDGERESSRAIFDALPMLITAKDVWLHSVESPGVDTLHVDDSVRDLADALSRHGVNVEVGMSKAKARDTGKQLLSVAADHGADCMVFGAPVHSRLRDVLLGSAAYYALDNSKIPVLFSS